LIGIHLIQERKYWSKSREENLDESTNQVQDPQTSNSTVFNQNPGFSTP